MVISTSFIEKYGDPVLESYWFYDNTVELRYDSKNHVYYLVNNENLIAQDGVTTVNHIIDKSEALVPWGCKMMYEKIMRTVPTGGLSGERIDLSTEEFERLIRAAKSAHKDELEKAANIGTLAHNWIETYIKNLISGNKYEIQPFPDNEKSASCCRAALNWMREHNVRWISTERKIYSKTYGYAGTMDGKCLADSCTNKLCCPEEFKDRLTLADWKSSNYLYIEYLYQVAAYRYADNEEFGTEIQDAWIIRLGKDNGEFEPWHFGSKEEFEEDFQGFLNCLNLYRSVKKTNERVASVKKQVAAIKKAKKKADKEEALKLECKAFAKYKGIRKPTCGCVACNKKYDELHESAGVV